MASMVTTESATAAATAPNPLSGARDVSMFCRFTLGVVKADMTSAVIRPTSPPRSPTATTTITTSAVASHDS